METLLDNSHKYVGIESDMDSLTLKKIFQDIQVLKRSLPSGIWVKTFENRMVNHIIQFYCNKNNELLKLNYN